MRVFLFRLDRALAAVPADTLARRAFRVLLLGAAFAGLDDDGRLHPGVQSRMWGALDEIDGVVREAADALEALDAAQRTGLREGLRGDLRLVERVASMVGRDGESLGLEAKTSRLLRRVVEAAGARLRDESPAAIIDHFVGEVAKHRRAVALENSRAIAAGGPRHSPAPGAGEGHPLLTAGALALGLGVDVGGGGLAMVVPAHEPTHEGPIAAFVASSGACGLGTWLLTWSASREAAPAISIPISP